MDHDDEATSQPRDESGEEHEIVLPEGSDEAPLCTCKGPAEDEDDPYTHAPECPYRAWLLS